MIFCLGVTLFKRGFIWFRWPIDGLNMVEDCKTGFDTFQHGVYYGETCFDLLQHALVTVKHD